MPDSLTQETIREIEPLSADEPVGTAARRVLESGLPGLPAVQLGAAEQASILQGRVVPALGPGASQVRMYGVGGRFLGVGRMSAEGARLSPERIMVKLPEDAISRA